MFNNRADRKRELSIYSILTIIVLISISGACARIPEMELITNERQDAGLLVTAKYIKARIIDTTPGYVGCEDPTDVLRLEQNGDYFTGFVKIDGKLVGHQGAWNMGDKVELSPGRHTFSFVIVKTGTKWPIKVVIEGQLRLFDKEVSEILSEIEVEPHRVYVLNVNLSHGYSGNIEWTNPDGMPIGMTYRTIKTDYKYYNSTGIATHPTDSKLSFKVK